jgi:hypothetical protein
MTQNEMVLRHLKRATLDPLTALDRYGVFRLGARVYELKRQGHTIKSRIVSQNGKRFARYLLVH